MLGLGNYCINWKTFQLNLRDSVNELFTDKIFTDVTLVSDDETQIHAHKFVLSACSPMLKNLLVKNVHPQPLIYMRGVGQEQAWVYTTVYVPGGSIS